jgi:hypothetical protein
LCVDASRRYIDSQARLANPAGPGQRDQPGRVQQFVELGLLALSPDETGRLGRQIVPARWHRVRCWWAGVASRPWWRHDGSRDSLGWAPESLQPSPVSLGQLEGTGQAFDRVGVRLVLAAFEVVDAARA